MPKPSQQFIEKYIESYNKGDVITDVLVEYEVDKVTMACTCTDTITSSDCPNSYYDGIDNCCRKRFPNGEYWNKTIKLKVNPKDNTITIKKLKDSWNKDEIITKMKLALQKGIYLEATVELDFDEDKWIEENL